MDRCLQKITQQQTTQREAHEQITCFAQRNDELRTIPGKSGL